MLVSNRNERMFLILSKVQTLLKIRRQWEKRLPNLIQKMIWLTSLCTNRMHTQRKVEVTLAETLQVSNHKSNLNESHHRILISNFLNSSCIRHSDSHLSKFSS